MAFASAVRRTIVSLLILLPTLSLAQTAGQVMFVGFNADGNDGFSFVTLVDLANGTNIRFNDNEWNGSPIGGGGAFNAGEGSMTWNNNTGNPILAGTIITITNSATTPAVTIGTITAGTIDLGTTNEVLYMFVGTNASTPTTFLSAIANDTFTNGSIANTGLTAGTNALSVTGDEDVMIYTGSINCTSTIVNCTTALATTSNWTTQDTGADDSANGFPDFPTDAPCNFYGVAFGVVTYYSRNATSGGAWDDNTSWTTNADGSGGPLAAGVWPRRHDHVTILSGHTITINAINDNQSCGVSPDDLPLSNVGAFTSSNVDMFYHTGDITIAGTLSTTGIEMMVAGYTHVLAGGTFSLASNLVNVGYLEADATSTFSSLDDLVLTGSSITIINTNSTSTDDLIIDFTDASLCGTGAATLQNGAGSQITYTNGATVAQICTTFTINCTGIGCSGFPVVGSGDGDSGNTGPGGVGNASTNKLWLMANEAVYIDGGTTLAADNQTVQQWNDQSGNGRNASEATNKPTYRTNIVNGMPSVRFDNTDRLLSTALTTANSASVFVVAQYSSLPSTNPGLVQGSPSGLGFSGTGTDKVIGMWVSSGSLPWGRVVEADNNSVNIPQVTSLSASTFFVLSNIISASTLNVSQYINNVISGSVAYDGTLRSWTDFGIGRQGTETWFGDISEVVVYNTALNTAQRAIISNYLSAKYASTLSVANDLYTMDNPANGNFDYEVAGIGQASDGTNHKDAKGTGIVRMVIQSPSSLENDEYLLWGHDNATLLSNLIDVDGTIIEERLSRIWRVSETGDVGSVALSFDISSLTGSPLGANLRLLIDRDGDGFADNDVSPISGGTFSGDIITFTGVNLQTGDRFTLGNTDLTNPLPIELLDFTAEPTEAAVLLKWSTASELNNDFFTLQRSQDAEQWEEVVRIKGAGTTSERIDYQTMDGLPYAGVSYYRLKQTDFDGQFSYSPVHRVELSPSYHLKVYPNPSNGIFTLSTGFELQPENVRLINTVGQEIPVRLEPMGSATTVQPVTIAPGLYILQVVKGYWQRAVRVIIE